MAASHVSEALQRVFAGEGQMTSCNNSSWKKMVGRSKKGMMKVVRCYEGLKVGNF